MTCSRPAVQGKSQCSRSFAVSTDNSTVRVWPNPAEPTVGNRLPHASSRRCGWMSARSAVRPNSGRRPPRTDRCHRSDRAIASTPAPGHLRLRAPSGATERAVQVIGSDIARARSTRIRPGHRPSCCRADRRLALSVHAPCDECVHRRPATGRAALRGPALSRLSDRAAASNDVESASWRGWPNTRAGPGSPPLPRERDVGVAARHDPM